ncbi:MAG: hypothetical protein A3G93_11785 [Nitrospinae bacterium RIFCSPLOWO2_12_FULL_45_22]|nr:MAG: hypothetical protein A3G93_11785 [Nitrospinae bacterium RIFCSPLOWO2_12_FULL_45_22]
MKIGIMLRHINELGGIVVYTVNLIEELLKNDSKNEYVFIYNRPEFLGRYSGYHNVREKVVKMPNKLLWDQFAVPVVARKEKLDLIFNPKLSIPLFTHCKTILVYHGAEQFAVPELFKWHDRMYFKTIVPFYFAKADAVISMTYKGSKDLTRLVGANEKKITAIYESHHNRFRVIEDQKALKKIREKYRLPEKFILFVGGLAPLKNFGNLLRAYQKLDKKISINLVAVGFKRWKFESDLRLINELKLDGKVIFTGFVPDEDLPAIYSLAHQFILPSFYEGFGIPVLEAMACGCPVITSTTGCSSEVSGDAAVLIDPRDVDGIAEAMYKIAVDTDLRNKMVEKGLKRAKDFSWEKCARETLALFESVVDSR